MTYPDGALRSRLDNSDFYGEPLNPRNDGVTPSAFQTAQLNETFIHFAAMTNSFSAKSTILAILLIFTQSCAPGKLFVRDADLHELHDRLEALEKNQETQADRLVLLLDAYEIQHKLLLENLAKPDQTIKYLDERIKDIHTDTCRKLSRLGFSANHESATDPWLEAISTDKLMVGSIEKVRLTPPGRIFHARIDTGATTSSLDARNIEAFERDGRAWVRFEVADEEGGILHTVEKAVERHVRVLHSSSDTRNRRPVVRLQFQLGRVKMIEEFTLVDRAHLDYQVLIGRNILRDLMVVDVAQKFIVPLGKADNGAGEAGGE